MKGLLIGEEESKRAIYFCRAAKEMGYELQLVPIRTLYNYTTDELKRLLDGHITKIDPYSCKLSEFYKMPDLVGSYVRFLEKLVSITEANFLNHPKDILTALDKNKCKQQLQMKGLAVTPACEFYGNSWMDLKEFMDNNQVSRVFVKPRYGSGAAGVMAYARHKRANREILYTSLICENGIFYNTKQLSRYTNNEKIALLGDCVIKQGAIIEHWLPKAKFKDKAYDIRVVYQMGRRVFAVARGSNSPITNLHLNNGAISIDKLGIPNRVWSSIDDLCEGAMRELNGLTYAGIDILLTGQQLNPYIIEVNGQGDLIYQDIYNNNMIYRQQVERMSTTDGVIRTGSTYRKKQN